MKAMILAAGVGSRLRPLTEVVSKPMTPMLNKPVMEHIINLLQAQDVIEVIANLHYRGDHIKKYFGNGSNYGVNLHYSYEEQLLGTAGGVKRVADFFNETFIVISGDALTDVNINEVYRFHKSKKALATICLKEVTNVEKYGVVITDEDGKIKSFQEKPAREEALSNTVNTGIYIFEPEVFDYIPSNQVYDFGRELFPKLVEINAPFFGYNITNYWNDIGSLEEYFKSHIDTLEGKVKVKFDGQFKDNSWFDNDVIMDKSVLIVGRNVIGREAIISEGAMLRGNVVIGNGCYIGRGTNLSNVIIWDNERIPDNTELKNCIVGAGNIIKFNGNQCNIISIK